MTNQRPVRYSFLSRTLAAAVLTGIYCVSFIGGTALLVGASSTAAHAQRGDGWDRGRGRGERGRGRGRGWDRGRGRGRGTCVINGRGIRVCL